MEGFELLFDLGVVLKKGQGFLHRHVQHVRDGLAAVLDLQGFMVIALAFARLAGHKDICQKMHFNFQQPVALAGLAAPALHIERKAPAVIASGFCLIGLGEGGADQVKQPRVGGRVAPGRAPDGGLVDVDDLVQLLNPLDAVMGAGIGGGAVQIPGQGVVEDLVHQAALARS